MAKSVFTGEHKVLVDVLVAARIKAGMTQAELARLVGKDQSYISLIERSQRRVDVLEFYALATALGVEPVALFAEVADGLSPQINI